MTAILRDRVPSHFKMPVIERMEDMTEALLWYVSLTAV